MKSRLTDTIILKGYLYDALLRKPREHLTDSEVELMDTLAEDCEVQSFLESETVNMLERSLGKVKQ
jgi:hypothetical protein